MAQRAEGNLRRNHDVTRNHDVKSLTGNTRGTGRKRRANGSFVANRDQLVDCASDIEYSDSEAIPMRRSNGTIVPDGLADGCTCSSWLTEQLFDDLIDGAPMPRAGAAAPVDGPYCMECVLALVYGQRAVVLALRTLKDEIQKVDHVQFYVRTLFHCNMLFVLSRVLRKVFSPGGPEFYCEELVNHLASIGHHWTRLYESFDKWFPLLRRVVAAKAADRVLQRALTLQYNRRHGLCQLMRPCPRIATRLSWVVGDLDVSDFDWLEQTDL